MSNEVYDAQKDTSTPYDDTFRTLLVDCTRLIIPVINEAFGEHYSGKETVITHTDYHFKHSKNAKLTKLESDCNITLIGIEHKNYHLECQSSTDGTMLIRMFEYDTQIAIENGRVEGSIYEVEFPNSAVLYLRHNKNTPDKYTICIKAGKEKLSYDIPVIKVQMYGIEEIFEKKLYFLIPFYIFVYEGQFSEINSDAKKLEDLRGVYEEICEKLEKAHEAGDISQYERNTILELSVVVVRSIAKKYERVRKGLGEFMGGKVLNYPTKELCNRYWEKGREEGLEKGQQEGRCIEMSNIIGIIRKKLAKEMNAEEIAELLETDLAYVKKVVNLIKENPKVEDLIIARIICGEDKKN